ncbi:chromate efflux transporter [Methylobacterium sp. Leaf106]|uniref:chromate efflux transporter n=1 Tax=Methylobacterium sp. Leaf106 TaxID=1736255 RepID=UPI0006F7296A|nr:chromate efflux transporter [Methylobacterium sp. Leaf106]KQP37755.1 chromate transporter [Methylobacterium sp. Leaf106]
MTPRSTTVMTPLPSREGSVREVFLAFLKLGLTAFGGPIAHLGYFRAEFVHRRRWLDEAAYADLVALCQFLPGPASSQVGFSLGVMRGRGLAGGLAAWAAFTLPSALLLVAFAYGADALGGPVGSGIVHGLKLVAVAVVAQAVWGMGRTLAPDATRAAIAFAALALTTVLAGSTGQVAGIGLGAVAGLAVCRRASGAACGHLGIPVSRRAGAVALLLFGLFLAVPPFLARSLSSQGLALFDAFYRSGALVFGGGHVMLPLLRTALVETGWIGPDAFLAGYGAAQAVPGPLFTFAAYLGAALGPQPNGLAGAAIALVAVFLPGLLLVYGALPFWDAVRERPLAQAAMRGANAAVVGILAAALYDPLWTGAVLGPRDFAVAAGAFLLLTIAAAPPWIVVVLTAVAGAGLAVVGG